MRLESGDTIAVHLGPAWFLENQGFELGIEDPVVVTGARVRIKGAPALIAQTVATSDRELVLRDADGIPRWSGTPARPVERSFTRHVAPRIESGYDGSN